MSETAAPRLLVVDDDPALLRALCATLAEQGYDCVGFGSGPQALAALEHQPFDLLLTDLSMPGMDGIAVLRAALQRDPLLVGIVLTGAATVATAVEAMRSGAFDYIQKPFRLRAMLPVIERAMAMRQLRRQKAELEQRMREHGVALHEANQELEAFVHSVSHDLRSPLSGIIGLSNILAHDIPSPPLEQVRTFAQRIHRAGLRMNALIDDLLKLSQVSRRDMQRGYVDLSAMAIEILVALRAASPGRQVRSRVEPGLRARGDAGLLRIALENLLGNAWKYTGRSADPQIDFSADIRDGVVYMVRDNGAGFDMAQAQHLFEPFQRLHGESEFEGTGIGLSIVQRIVQRHHGRIWAEAEPGRGARFFFTLGEPNPA
jgi:signal transduction histidine kinase